jgi:hypothetical protein
MQDHTQHPFLVGQAWMFRTVTFANIGRITRIDGMFITLEEASWVADTGRFHNALLEGNLSEVEPFPHGCVVHLGSLVDAAPWVHELPSQQV